MRSISFGPTTHFGGGEREPDENEVPNQVISQIIQPLERILSNSSSHRIINEVIFYSGETLYRESMFGHKELAMKKYCKCKFTFDSSRNYQSYCHEFCGLLNLQFKDLKFLIANKEVGMQRQVRKPCEIEVMNYIDITKPQRNSIKPAFNKLLDKGLFSDIDIIINGMTVKAHKCILIARSDKFKAMIHSNMKESIENKVEISIQGLDPNIYKCMLQWIYEGECDLPDSVSDLLSLIQLTDEYLLPDLQKVCEDQIVENLNGSGALEILTNSNLVIPSSSESRIKEVAKSVLLDQYEKIEEIFPDIEERIAKVKGLMSELFIHKRKVKELRRKRRHSLGGDEAHKKKVRFNISNTIYEEASAIHDESDSLIEPLSIYSNNSPPGEINDEIIVGGSTHSSIHAEGRRSENLGEQLQTVVTNSQEDIHIQDRQFRPQSAGRRENMQRSNSSLTLSSIQPSAPNGNNDGTQTNENGDQPIFGNPIFPRLKDTYLTFLFVSMQNLQLSQILFNQYQKTISEDTQNTIDSLNNHYHELLLSKCFRNSISEIIKILVANIGNPSFISTIRKAAIKTLMKLVQFEHIREQLEIQETFNIQELIGSILESKFDSVDQEEEEQILLLIQKLILKLLSVFTINEDSILKGIKYFMKVHKIRALEEQDSYNTLQFMDLTKSNFHKLLHFVINLDRHTSLKQKMLYKLFNQVKKAFTKVDKTKGYNRRVIEYIIFMIKTIEDCLRKIKDDTELCSLILILKNVIIEVICVGGENDEIMIRNQSQQLFSLLLKIILDLKLAMREELELMFTKLVLKPIITQTKKMKTKEETSKINPNSISEVEKKSAQDDDEIENEDFIQVTYERTVHEDILLEMSLNYLLETLLSLTTEQLGSLFVLYDCQPFSENIVLKSLILIFKHSQSNPAQYLRHGILLTEKFKQMDLSQIQINASGPQSINYMLEQKSTIRKLAKDINAKFKVGLQKIDDMYKYIDEETPAEVASKILLFSRDIQIDKIAEILGGKDERAKDYKNTFKTKEEAYEFAYLIIVLQTCQHNPSVKNKTDLKSFIESAQNICPKSMDSFPPNFFEDIYNSVTKFPFFTPNSRSLLDEKFNGYSLNEIDIRLSKINKENSDMQITENEFINTSDLTQNQLFNYNNNVHVPSTLIPQSLKYILNYITSRFLRFSLSQLNSEDKQQLKQNFDLLTTLVHLNKAFQGNDNVDRIFQVIYKLIKKSYDDDLYSNFEHLLWTNFDCIKKSLILIPKLSIQSFMRDEIKENASDVFQATLRLITNQTIEKQKESSKKQEEAKVHKGTSLIDLVFNYFTDNNEEQKKVEKSEIDTLVDFRKRLLMEDQEENQEGEPEQRFDDKKGKEISIAENSKHLLKWLRDQNRMHDLITLVCSYIRENLNQEEGILSLAFLDHLMSKSDSQETQEKLWVELHLLLTQSLKLRMDIDIPISREDCKGDYEVISTDTSQDSIEGTKDEFDFFHKETCPIKTKLYQCMTRHLIVMLHSKISKQVIMFKMDIQHIVRDMQRVISLVIQNSHDKTLDPLKTIDEHFLFHQLNLFTKPVLKIGQIHLNLHLKNYPKISKFLRLILILLLKGASKKDETEGYSTYHQLGVLTNVTYYLQDMAQSLPFDLITLCQDVLIRYQLPSKHTFQEQMHDNMNTSYENLFSSILKTHVINDESNFQLWLKIIQLLQEKIIQHPSFKKSELQSMRTFSILKNTALNQPFEIKEKNYQLIQKLFENCLFSMTFESMNIDKKLLEKQGKDKDELAIKASFDSHLEQACIFSVNMMTDVFIYYISMIFAEKLQDQQEVENRQKLFTFLWLNFLKVLLHYAEQSHSVGLTQLVQTVYENIKRIIEFLMHEQIIKDDQENNETQKIWKLTWDYVGAFFKDLKTTVLSESQSIK